MSALLHFRHCDKNFSSPACDLGLQELGRVADYIGDEQIRFTGIGEYAGYDVIAVPTILVEKPVTLVGMGDTISSVSLVGALKAV